MAFEYRTTHKYSDHHYIYIYKLTFLLDWFQIGDKPDEEEDDVVEHTDDGEWALVADVL